MQRSPRWITAHECAHDEAIGFGVTAVVVLSLIGGWLYGSHTMQTYAAPRWQMMTVVLHVGQGIPYL
jgi:hypothetical protein